MKQVINAYGKFLAEGTVLVLLLIIIFTGITDDAGNRGVFAMIGARLDIESINHKEYTDFKVTYQNVSNQAAPVITYAGAHLRTGTNKLSDSIKALDHAGNELAINVISITDTGGTELIDSYNHDTAEISFVSSGIYTVTVSASDENNKSTICTIRIPVSY